MQKVKKQAQRLVKQALCLRESFKFQEALAVLDRALIVFRGLQDQDNEMIILDLLGETYQDIGKDNVAIQFHKEAFEMAVQFENQEIQGSAANNMGLALQFLGNYDQSELWFYRALEIYEQTPHLTAAAVLANLGLLDFYRDEYDQSIKKFRNALKILDGTDEIEDQARTWHDLGNAYRMKGDVKKSSVCIEKAIQLHQKVNHLTGIAESLSLLGLLYYENDQLSRASDALEKGLATIKDLDTPVQHRDLLSNLALVSLGLNQNKEALLLTNKALALLNRTENEVVYGILLNNLALIQRVMGEYEESHKNFLLSFMIRKKYGTESETETTLYNLGNVSYFKREFNEAHRYFMESLQLCQKHNWHVRMGLTLSALGLVYDQLGHVAKSSQSYQEAIVILQQHDDFEGLWSAYYNWGRFLEETMHDVNGAQEAYINSIKNLMLARRRISVEHRASYAEDKVKVFDRLVAIFVSKNDFVRAFKYTELAKARAFMDLILVTNHSMKELVNSENTELVSVSSVGQLRALLLA